MEGVSFMLRKNCDAIAAKGTQLRHIIATGGGSKSPIWCQLQADITGLPVVIPAEKEAACLGAAMIAAVSDGKYSDYSTAAEDCVSMSHRYEPNPTQFLDRKYRQFCALYKATLDITRM